MSNFLKHYRVSRDETKIEITKAQWERLWSHCHLQGCLNENQDEILYMNRYECLPHHSCVFLEEVECETCCLTLLNV